ncbi:MAG TPA: pyridoxal phosphate-dependent aminotransferase, partial [Candidatus Saccharimonadales bacterium]|nr:pyridoxal phosphate-dependent aminotransferase [Candidatus Saccharimonadales bacterium]
MEFGIPGLPTSPIAREAEARALESPGVSNVYAPFDGIPELKAEASRFVKLFMDLDVPPACIVPSVGAMEGCFAGLALAGRLKERARTVIFLQPGFPVNGMQARLLGLDVASIDFYDHRGETLIRAVEDRVRKGDVCAILWSSPNNPSWIVLKEDELRGLGRICDEHGVLALEDLAYFGMDLRQDYLKPGEPPYQPTVMRYTSHGICIISSSKMFSYAGQRIALCVISPELATRNEPALVSSLGTPSVAHALTHGVLYPICASVPQSPQWGLTALLEAANRGDTGLWKPAHEYARRAGIMKKHFLDAGFRLVYDNDLGEPLADGFYFTIAYPGFERGGDLIEALLPYGVSAITLEAAGSCRLEGLRACVSMVADDQFETLAARLRKFAEDHPAGASR